jgi:hypothetical protein
MRRAYILIEMLTVLIILTIIAIPLGYLERETLYNIPSAHKMVQSHIQMQNFLGIFENDINAAVGFPDAYGDYNNVDGNILIKLNDKIICYKYEEEKIQRLILTQGEKNSDPNGPEVRVWQIPYGSVQWSPRRNDSHVDAVEVKTNIRRRQSENWENKFANSYLFFPGLYTKEIK